MRWLKLAGLLALLAVFLIGAQKIGSPSCGISLHHDKQVTINGQVVFLQIADDEPERNKGLSKLECISENEGMLFKFDQPGFYKFWMKETLIALDMVWLDVDQKIVTIKQGVRPSSYPSEFTSDKPAKYVIELPAGRAEKLRLAENQKIDF